MIPRGFPTGSVEGGGDRFMSLFFDLKEKVEREDLEFRPLSGGCQES